MHCFEHDVNKAACLSSCFMGEHFEDSQPRSSWSCKVLLPLPTPPFCSTAREDCTNSMCCKDSGSICFQKNEYWAECLPTCSPHEHTARLPLGTLEPWTCKELHPSVPPAVLRKVTEEPISFTSIFCWSIARTQKTGSGMSELDLIHAQYPRAAGIFSCDEYMLFSDRELDYIPFSHIIASLVGRTHVPGSLTATWVNADDFINAWERVIRDIRYANHDWVVKADPDAVFSADALRQHLGNYKGQASSDRGVYMKNCEAGPRGLQLFGSMELLSLGAMKTFGANRELCKTMIHHELMGEDLWLQRCLDQIGVPPLEDYLFLADGYCPSSRPIAACAPPSVAFHPFKMPDQWLRCWENMTGQQRNPDG